MGELRDDPPPLMPQSQQRQAAAQATGGSKLLPNSPISVPRLDWADVHLRYHGAHIVGRNVPLDDLTIVMEVVAGRMTVHPINFGVGKGHLFANVDLTPKVAHVCACQGRSSHAKSRSFTNDGSNSNLQEGAGSVGARPDEDIPGIRLHP